VMSRDLALRVAADIASDPWDGRPSREGHFISLLQQRLPRLVIRDLTPDTEGNATGVGMAEVVLKRLVDKIDPLKTYMNMITSKGPEGARIPMTMENDRRALYIALACCLDTKVETARIARIRSTKYVEDLWVSEPFLEQVLAGGRAELINEPGPILFDADDMFTEDW